MLSKGIQQDANCTNEEYSSTNLSKHIESKY
jgi:hypothetical protein